MHKAWPICKAYFAADVKRIMPPNVAGGVDNCPICSIMGLSIRAAILLTRLRSGGHDAYLDAERS